MDTRRKTHRICSKSGLESLALALVSASIISYQIVLMQLLATVVWYHFAYLVISFALLGFGFSGTLLALGRQRSLTFAWISIPIVAALCALSMVSAVALVGGGFLRIDLYPVLADPKTYLGLLATEFVLIVPFTCGALVIATVLLKNPDRAGKTYALNLSSSALGGLCTPLLLSGLAPNQALLVPTAMAGLGGLVMIGRSGRTGRVATLLILGLTGLVAVFPTGIPPSVHKDLARLLSLPRARVLSSEPDSHGVFQIVEAEGLRLNVPLSLETQSPLPPILVACVNGDAVHSLIAPLNDPAEIYVHTPEGVLSDLIPPGPVWLFDPETSLPIAAWAQLERHPVTATVGHPQLKQRLATQFPRAEFTTVRPRAFLQTVSGSASLIRLPSPGPYLGSPGLGALNEQPLFTTEGLAAAFDRLKPDGILVVTVAIDHPLRVAPRLLQTLKSALKRNEAIEPASRMVALQTWSTLTFLVRRGGWEAGTLRSLAAFAREAGFDLIGASNIGIPAGESVHTFEDPSTFDRFRLRFETAETNPDPSELFRTEAATDQRPYFSQFVAIRNIPRLLQTVDWRTAVYLEPELFLVLLTLIQLIGLASIMILIPWLGRSDRRPPLDMAVRTFVCATGLGLGFICAEIGMIQRTICLTGNPVSAASVVLTLLLLSAGAGSWFSHRHRRLVQGPVRPALMLALTFSILAILSKLPIQSTNSAMIWIQGALALFAGFLMGMPFPALIDHIGRQCPALLPWTWGVNGTFSVIGAPVAILILITAGFSALSLTAATAYAAAAGSALFLRRTA